ERICSRTMGNSPLPVKIAAARAFKIRYDFAQFRMHRSTVIALVVVLHDHFPIRGHIVDDLLRRSKLTQGKAAEPFGNAPKLEKQRSGSKFVLFGREIYKEEPAPSLDAHRIERKVLLREMLRFGKE